MLISPDEIKKSLSNMGWEYVNKKIFKSFTFDIYREIVKHVVSCKLNSMLILMDVCKFSV